MNLIDKFKAFSKDFTSTIKYDEPMKNYTTFKTGGNAEILISPNSFEELSLVLEFCKYNKIKPFILGNGSNLLVKDKGIEGVVIHLGKDFEDITLVDDTTIVCLAGTNLMKLCRFAYENALTGLEFAYGIPGSVGGGCYMNAGAYGGELKDVLYKCEHISFDGTVGSYENDELKLSYRTSAYKDSDLIITKAYFKLQKGDKDQIKEKMDDFMSRRKSKQPLEYPSAGSTFKRPEGAFAAALIEECGLKGFSVGDAQVSEKHSGFVINKGNATFDDIMHLVEEVQKKVKTDTGYELELEPEILR